MQSFTIQEKKLIGGISLLLAIRMMGTSLIIPVFSIFATGIADASRPLAGLAVGIYGIAQMLFQIPMGRISDRIGRKETVLAGLAVYFLGTLICGLSDNIYVLIISRAIAGAGAVSGVTMAWLSEGVNINLRSTAMSYVGMSIGLSVITGFSFSSLIAGHVGVPVLFFLISGMTLLAMYVTVKYLNNVDEDKPVIDEELHVDRRGLMTVLKHRDLLRLNVIGFFSNLSLTGMFFIMPLLINENMEIKAMWKIYVPMAVIGTMFMYYFGRKADTQGTRKIAMVALFFQITGIALPILFSGLIPLFVSFAYFYIGHCILSPVLPSAVSRYPSTTDRGSIMSIFNSFQFLGSGLGGIISGFIGGYHPVFVFTFLEICVIISFILMSRFRNYSTDSFSS